MKWILLFFVLYATWFIASSSFPVDGIRHFCLFDDSMISMRYAKNFAEGHGLVWNASSPQERVEGFSNPGWTLLMAGVHLFPIAQAKISLIVQIIGALCYLGTVVLVFKISERLDSLNRTRAVLAALFTATYVPLAQWSFMGTEVSILCLLVALSYYLFIIGRDLQMFFALSLMLLVRPDTLPLFLIFSVVAIRKGSERNWDHAFGACALGFGLWMLFRLFYYDSVFPNTYWLKMTGYPLTWRVAHGAYFFLSLLLAGGLFTFVLPMTRKVDLFGLLKPLILCQCAYSIFVGGDAWEAYGGANRYISVIMPLFFILAADWATSFKRWRLAAVACLISYNALLGPRSLLDILPPRPLLVEQNIRWTTLGKLVEAHIPDRATVAVFTAGALPYFSNRTCVDMLGKCDKRVAHARAEQPDPRAPLLMKIGHWWPGHRKTDYAHSIASLHPDVIAQVRREDKETMLLYMGGQYVETSPDFWIRRPLLATLTGSK